MLLENFAKSVCQLTQKDENGTNRLGESFLNTMDPSYGTIAKYSRANSLMCMCLGTGDTEPTVSDLKLAEDVTTTLTYITGSVNRSLSKMLCIISCTFRNDTNAPITIKEIGMAKNYSAYYNTNVAILYTRSVLETPVTMGVGETYTFSYEVDIA